MKKTQHFSRPFLSLFLLFLVNLSVIAQSGIYVGGHFRRQRTVTVPTLKASGFTDVILFNIQVETNGDLTTDGEKICSNGVYVFATTQPNYVADVTSLKTGMTSVRRVENCIGGWGSHSYNNIKTLVNAQGTGSTSMLYKNFQALKAAIPVVDAINNDDEAGYDLTTGTAFHVMLYDLGFKTTLAPYMNKNYWQSLATNINNLRPGAVDRIYLQCYDGGAGNIPKDWNINNIPMSVGMLHFNSSGTINTTMAGWKKSTTNVVGGFLWVYNDNDFVLKTYAAAITGVFGGGDVVSVDKMKPYMTAYSEVNYGGTAANFAKGDFNMAGITAQGLLNKSVSSIKLAPGFKVKLYKLNNYIGTPFIITENTPSLVELGCNDSISSWLVRANGDITLSGKIVYMKNKKTGLFLGIREESVTSGSNIQQQVFVGNENQKWSLIHIGDGVYRILNGNSKLQLQVRTSSMEDNAVIDQAVFSGQDNQKMIIQQSGNAGYHKIIPFNSAKYLKTETDFVDANIVQGGISADNETDWELVIADQTAVEDNPARNSFHVYPNPVSDYLIIENGDLLISKITIVDLEGRSIQMKENNNRIDVSTLVPGMYFVNVYLDGNPTPIVIKFIKQK